MSETIVAELRKHFQRRVVITLNRFSEFYEHVTQAAYPHPAAPDPIEWFAGIDARKCKPPPYWTNIPALWGCGESHRQVIARALSDGIETFCIMEDDCRFAQQAIGTLAEAMFELPDDWQGVMLGGQVGIPDGKTTPISPHISRCDGHVERLHCYALNREGMQIFHDVLCEATNEPDDYRWGRIQAEGKIRVYRVEPFIAYQCDGPSSISGRLEGVRTWDDRVSAPIRDAATIPVISLVCPFDVLEYLRSQGLIFNGGDSLPYASDMLMEEIEKSDRRVADMMLRMPAESIQNAVRNMRGAAAHHRKAIVALWHPTENIAHPGATWVRGKTSAEVIKQIAKLLP